MSKRKSNLISSYFKPCSSDLSSSDSRNSLSSLSNQVNTNFNNITSSDSNIIDVDENRSEIDENRSEIDEKRSDKSDIKKQKVSKVRDQYDPAWEYEFFVCKLELADGTFVTRCLLCLHDPNKNKNILNQVYVVRKHYNSLHSKQLIEEKLNVESCNVDPVKKLKRSEKIKSLKEDFHKQQLIILKALNPTQQSVLGSFNVAYLIAKNKKPFQDAELMKQISTSILKDLLEVTYDISDKAKRNLLNKLRGVPLSRETIRTRTNVSYD
jgi:hypothetical protein